MEADPVQILLVDDDDVDVEVVTRGFKKHRIANPITVAQNGAEALAILRGDERAPFARPYLILLDLNMPVMDGFEFLTALRADHHLRDSIVFVLTTSSADADRARSYEANVAGYLVKSEAGLSFKKTVELLECYWTTVSMPA